MELGPCVCPGVEGVNVVWVGSGVGFAAVDDDDVVSPQGCTVTATFGGWGRGIWQGCYEGPVERFQIETIDTVVYYESALNTQTAK